MQRQHPFDAGPILSLIYYHEHVCCVRAHGGCVSLVIVDPFQVFESFCNPACFCFDEFAINFYLR